MEEPKFSAPAWFETGLDWLGFLFEAGGVAAIVLALVSSIARAVLGTARGDDWGQIYHTFRTNLARGILLGLEFLIAADIIGTVTVQPTLDNLMVLGLIILVRTFLSFTLDLEINGRWPWQGSQASKRQAVE